MKSSKIIIEKFPLVENNGILQQKESDVANPYLDMFSSVNLSDFSEVILWKEYNRGLGITHNVPIGVQTGCYVNGLTRGYVDNFLLDNGKPIYADSQNYRGDDYIEDVRQNRDGRLWLFLKEPGQKNILFNIDGTDRANPIEDYPNVISSNAEAMEQDILLEKEERLMEVKWTQIMVVILVPLCLDQLKLI